MQSPVAGGSEVGGGISEARVYCGRQECGQTDGLAPYTREGCRGC